MAPIRLYANTIFLLRHRSKLLHSGLRTFDVRQNIVRSRGRYISVAQNQLNVLIVHAHLVQPGAESTAKCMPAEPRSVDVLWDVAARNIVQVEGAQQFFPAKQNPACTSSESFSVRV